VSKGVSFQTFSLPENRCVRLLIKNLGGAWGPGDLCPGSPTAPLRTPGPGPRKGPPCHPTFYCNDGTRSWCEQGARSLSYVRSELLWSHTRPPGDLCSAGAASALDTPSVAVVTHLGASRVARPTCQAGVRRVSIWLYLPLKMHICWSNKV
jgi:hypothetical protein